MTMDTIPESGAELQALELRNRQINAVHTISRQLSSTLDLDERLRQILTVSMQAVDAAAGTIFLHRASDDRLVFRHVVGGGGEQLIGAGISASEGIAGEVFRTGQAKITNRPQEAKSFRREVGEQVGFVTTSIVTIPLQYQEGRPVGVMQILNKAEGEFDSSDLEVLEIVASIAAAAIENAELHREAQIAAVAHAVGDLSHDIKNKVTPITLSVETLRPMMDDMYAGLDRLRRELPDPRAEELESACGMVRDFYSESFDIIEDQVREVQVLAKLVADALKGSVTEPSLEPNELNPLIERQLDLLESSAQHAGVKLVRELQDVPEFRFDRFLVERAVYNLVNNAIPETPAGGQIAIRTGTVAEGRFPDGGYACVEVSDTGRGMEPHVLERILRGDARSTKQGGTGLGTRIVYYAVAAHRGAFEGESSPGKGTTFRMKLPWLKVEG